VTEIDRRGDGKTATRPLSASARWWIGAAALPLLAACALLAASPPAHQPPRVLDLTAIVNESAPALPVAAAPVAEEPAADSVEVTVKRNDTLDRIFRSVGIDLATLAELRMLPDARKALDILRPGDIITLTHTDGALLELNRRIDAFDFAGRRRLRGELHRKPARGRDRRRQCDDRVLAVRGRPRRRALGRDDHGRRQ